MDAKGKVAVVTGGASGLGAATVRALVARGAKVGIIDKSTGPGEPLAKELGASVLLLSADVTNEEQLGAAIERTKSELGGLHIAVGCAGIGTAGRVVGKAGLFPLELFRITVEVNLVGMFNLVRLAAGAMVQAQPDAGGERGVIVTTASIAAFDGQIGQAAYSASKAGVAGMTLPIARELARFGVRLVTIAPGTFDTPMLATLPEEARNALAAGIPFPNRLGNPAEFAALALHIVENAMLNGETIRLDGALRMPPK
ncbi:MAG TPA: SDR family NAD(P)-dependent oxidoreductase [Polyangiaceae bacterium]|nr:SDR family NAD(P)-dependent oxidoreductase [Polyangiaceae bacterium]